MVAGHHIGGPAPAGYTTQAGRWVLHPMVVRGGRGQAGPTTFRRRRCATAAWIVWLGVAVLLGVAEAFTLTAAFGLLGAAALITAGTASLGLLVAAQPVVFAVSTGVGVLALRPVAARQMLRPRLERFGINARTGRTAYVVDEVSDRTGTVLIGGEEWTARPLDESAVIPSGTAVAVFRIDGVTAVVYPQE